MGPACLSFEVRGPREGAVTRELGRTVALVSNPTAALVFVSGALERQLPSLARAIADARLGIPVLCAAGTGVLTERAEIESEHAAAGIVWRGGHVRLLALETEKKDVELGEQIAAWLAASAVDEANSLLLFAQPKGFTPETFGPLRRGSLPRVAGAGTVGDSGVIAISEDGELLRGNIAALVLEHFSVPAIKAAHPCKYLTRLLPITEARGPLLLRIDGRPALDVLSEAGASTEGRPLVMTVLSAANQSESGSEEVLIRGVQGVDPGRGALLISDEIRVGDRIAFGIRDSDSARESLSLRLREAARESHGAAPAFALYFNCSGRGRGMYGVPSVDTRMIVERFPGLPVCGFHSAFEIAPYAGGPALQLYNGVFVLYSSPS